MRLDLYLVKEAFYPTRVLAQESIKSGQVKVLVRGEWTVVTKTSFVTDTQTKVQVDSNQTLWVSRAAKKLKGAIEDLDIDVRGQKILDLGQSTGGFTQVFLHFGAKQIVGVDVGHGQLHKSLLEDERVLSFEGQDARDLSFLEAHDFDFFSADLSFISLLKVAPEIKRVFGSKKLRGLFLVKPQFEVGRKKVGKGGLVKEPQALLECQKNVLEALEDLGYKILNYLPSRLRGKDGNQEFICFVSM